MKSSGDKKLFNPYGVIPVNPNKYPHIKDKLTMPIVATLTIAAISRIDERYRKTAMTLGEKSLKKPSILLE